MAFEQQGAYRMYAKDFPSLSGEQMHLVLRQVEVDEGEFFDLLVRQTYNGYYTDPRIVELLGLEARPPQPLGHSVDQISYAALLGGPGVILGADSSRR